MSHLENLSKEWVYKNYNIFQNYNALNYNRLGGLLKIYFIYFFYILPHFKY